MNAAGNHQVNEDMEVVPQPVEDLAAQVQPRDLQYIDMGHYGMVRDYPPPQGHRDHIIGDNARIVQDVPAQVHVAPPVPVCTDFTYRIHISNHTLHSQRGLAHLTSEFHKLQLVSLQPSSMNSLTRTLSLMDGPLKSFGNSQFSTCRTPIHELP